MEELRIRDLTIFNWFISQFSYLAAESVTHSMKSVTHFIKVSHKVSHIYVSLCPVMSSSKHGFKSTVYVRHQVRPLNNYLNFKLLARN